MIHKKSIVLVLDTNILSDLLDEISENDLLSVFKTWIHSILEKMTKKPTERIVTLVASKSMLNDYQTGLTHSGHKKIAKTIKLIFDTSLGRKFNLVKENRIFFSIQKYSTQIPNTSRLNDHDDEKFLSVIESVLRTKKWNDRSIVFVSRDRPTFSQIQVILNEYSSVHGGTLELLDDFKKLEKFVEC